MFKLFYIIIRQQPADILEGGIFRLARFILILGGTVGSGSKDVLGTLPYIEPFMHRENIFGLFETYLLPSPP